MPAKVFHVFGASGSGTTTLGAALAADLDVLHLDADDFYWRKTDPPYRIKVPPEERVDAILARVADHDRWVLSGSLCSWSSRLLHLFDVAVLVRLDPTERMRRLRAREYERYGARIDPGGDRHDEHLAFIAWAEKYDTEKAPLRTLHLHQQWLETLACRKFEVDSAVSVEALVQEIKQRSACP